MAAFRIMIVEDQREVSRLLRSALETLEHDLAVVEIPSGEEAILYSTLNKVDLMVTDYRLPGMTGIELMVKVRKNQPEAKIILVTGMTDPRIRKQVAEAGANAFFIKPVPMADFLDAVERHLGLIDTILPPEPIAVDVEEKKTPRNLPDLLTGLRQELAANAVFLLNDTGRILARAGDFPDSKNEVALIYSLLSIYSAGQKVGRLLGQKLPRNWHVFQGSRFDLLFAPVGSSHAMLVIGEDLADENKVLAVVDKFSIARSNIELALGEAAPGVPAIKGLPTTSPETVDQGTKEMDPLFKEARKKVKPAELNEFWNNAASQHKAPAKPDMLSYDQAKQLGLAPEDEP